MGPLTLDQIHVFLAVVDEGSFTKAATRLNRARSAVTYAIQKLEAQIGLPLFDRVAYRPTLTEAGRTLLWRARRIADESDAFQQSARSLASGLEAELTIVMDSMFPVLPIVEALRAFTMTFPTIQPRVYVQPLGAAAELVLDGTCVIGLLPLIFSDMAAFKSFPLLTIDLVPVVSPDHPLAAIEGTIETHVLQQHVQLMLTDRSALTAGPSEGNGQSTQPDGEWPVRLIAGIGCCVPGQQNGRQRPILGVASTTERTVARAGFELARRASSTGIGNRLGGSKVVVAAIQATSEPAS